MSAGHLVLATPCESTLKKKKKLISHAEDEGAPWSAAWIGHRERAVAAKAGEVAVLQKRPCTHIGTCTSVVRSDQSVFSLAMLPWTLLCK